jgi:hypothetical protein
MNFLHELLTFGIDWMYVMLSLLAATFGTVTWFTNKKSYGKIPYSMILCCILTLQTILILVIFSNRIDSSGKEVAIYEMDGKLTLQKDTGIYFGVYNAHYFSKNPLTICTNKQKGNPFSFPPKGCAVYTVNFDSFIHNSQTLSTPHLLSENFSFRSKNIHDKDNTERLIKTFLHLESDPSKLPPYIIWKVIE